MPKPAVYSLAVALKVETAKQIVKGALEEGRRQSMAPLTVVVLDAGGHVIVAEREDGAGILRFDVAQGKAYGALGIGLGSRTIGDRNKGREAFLAAVGSASEGRMIPVAGGVLVLNSDAQAVGAVGVSGDTSDADEQAAIAGIKSAGLTPAVDPAND